MLNEEFTKKHTQTMTFSHYDGWYFKVVVDGEFVEISYHEIEKLREKITIPLTFAKQMFPEIECMVKDHQVDID